MTITAERPTAAPRVRAVGLPRWAVALLGSVSVTVTAFTVWTCVAHWTWRVPSVFERTPADAAILVLSWVSIAAAFGVGLWLWARAPRNATGRWLWLAALALAAWFIGTLTPVAALNPLVVGAYLELPALAMALLGFPAGRPGARVRRWILVAALGATLAGVLSGLFQSGMYPWDWPQVMSPWQVGWVGLPAAAVSAWVFGVVPAVAAAVVLVRRQRRLPAGARRLTSTVTTSGVAVAVLEVVALATFNLGSAVLYEPGDHPATAFRVALAGQRVQLLVAAVGLARAFVRRARTVGSSAGRLELDLGRSGPIAAPSESLRHLVEDPTARVLFVHPDGSWFDEAGAAAAPGAPGRASTVVVDDRDEPVAAIDLDAAIAVSPALVEIAAGTVAARMEVERRTAVARATERELVAVQHAVLDASDASRRRLERNLHDGAQQRLVGLSLSARLAARHPDPDAVGFLVEGIDAAMAELVELVEADTPAVLDAGLATALATLAATCPLPTAVQVDGDLAGIDPAAATLWFVASEAVSNAVKHAGASQIALGLTVGAGHASVRVRDDGVGGVEGAPAAIAARVAEAGGTLRLQSPPGVGTEVVATVTRREDAP
ncbi:MAG: histidine kinase [Acidimicrobiales bacterium]